MENNYECLHDGTVSVLTKHFLWLKKKCLYWTLNIPSSVSCEDNSIKLRASVHTADGRMDGGPERETDKRQCGLAERTDAKVAIFNPTTKINSLIYECSYLPAHELYICMNPPWGQADCTYDGFIFLICHFTRNELTIPPLPV